MRKQNNKGLLTYLSLLLIISSIIGFSNYIRLPLASFSDTFSFIIHFGIITSAIFGILYFLSINKFIFYLFFPPIATISILSSCYLYLFNITITGAILEVTLNTDWQVTKEFLSIDIGVIILICIVIIAFTIHHRSRFNPLFRAKWALHLIISLILIFPAVYANSYRQNTIINRVPFTIINATKDYIKVKELYSIDRRDIALDAKVSKSDSLLVIVVIGEAVRNDHLGLNKYHRNTTPQLLKRDIISFSNNKSLYTYTAASIPQLLTRSDSQSPERAYSEKSIISVLNQCGFNTFWLANQTPDYTYDKIAKSAKYYSNASMTISTYSDIKWTDNKLLSLFKNIDLSSDVNQCVFLHSIGSHWYYNYRYPEKFKVFTPITKSRSIQHNSAIEIINSYDNSILYMDYFIDEIIHKIENKNSLLIYISDHGELLGENEMWLHASEHEKLHDAACFVWMSETYKEKNMDKYKSAIKNKNNETSTSLLFHSILGACDIETKILDQSQNIFSQH